jgi:hypothetical protein
MVEKKGPDNLPPANNGFVHRAKAGGGWVREPASPRQRFGATEVPIAVTQEETAERLGFDANHPDIATITGVGTNDSEFGQAIRKVMAETSRGEGPASTES